MQARLLFRRECVQDRAAHLRPQSNKPFSLLCGGEFRVIANVPSLGSRCLKVLSYRFALLWR